MYFVARSDVQVLEGDIAVQEGRYADAHDLYAQVIEKNPSADNLARLAYLTALTGDTDGADALYNQAEDDITAKEMRAYAWIEVQRGQLQLRRGRQAAAQAHYQRANAAYSGYWLVEEHLAELAGARGEYSDAIALYEGVIARTPRPEAAQALGDLYLYRGEPERAKPWHERALAAYLASVQRGEVHYLHQLSTFYADVRQDGARALDWARRDFAQRQDIAARDALAWAFFRDSQFDAGNTVMDQVLPFASADAHVLAHAAMIDFAIGRADAGKQLLRQAAIVNPYYQSFHVHH
jgi:tetratricopeptide (TPR) repeat protein